MRFRLAPTSMTLNCYKFKFVRNFALLRIFGGLYTARLPLRYLSYTLSCFRDIAGFLLRNWPHPYSARILGVFPLDQIADVGAGPSQHLKLISREIIFEVFHSMW